MKKLILTIKNNSDKAHKNIRLFGYNKTLPDGIMVYPDFVENGKTLKLTYSQIIDQISHMTEVVNVIKSTNNRKLNFWYMNAFGEQHQIEPDLEIDGTPREVKLGKKITLGNETFNESDMFLPQYKKQWNPSKWNIADTKEKFHLSYMFNMLLHEIKSCSIFEIQFKIHPRPFRPIPPQFITMPSFIK